MKVGDRVVGMGAPCVIVAEVGINHNGSLELAHRLIDAAAEAGADAVKFQNYVTEDFVIDRQLAYTYQVQGQTVTESQYAMFKRYELPQAWLQELKRHCEKRRVWFVSTPTGDAGVHDLVRVGAVMLKNGSDYLGHLPLIGTMARTGLPTILSTGMATLAEIDEAVGAFRSAGGRDLILLHCTSAYPTPPEQVHLPKMQALQAAFQCPVGLSDHTDGIVAALGAVALGACLIEKHFTLDKALSGPDHSFSADPQELQRLTKDVRTLEKQLRPAPIGPTVVEAVGRRDYRLSWVATQALPEGHCLLPDDLALKRPGNGLPASMLDWLLGRRLRRTVIAGEVIQPEDLS